MKNFVFIILSQILLSTCNSGKENRILTHIKVIEKINPAILKVEDGLFYSLKIDLSNKTDTILYYWTMSCSWQVNWYSKDNSIRFFIYCPKNTPELTYIKPNETISYSGIIEVLDSTNCIPNKKFKLGFILINKNEVTSDIDFYKILSSKIDAKKDIYWTNPFTLPNNP